MENNQVKTLALAISEKYQLIAEAYDDGIFSEMSIYLADNQGKKIQDITNVRHPYHMTEKDGKDVIEKIKNHIQILVWADCDNEDFTDDYEIGIYSEEG